jgi:hypothetical protein
MGGGASPNSFDRIIRILLLENDRFQKANDS